MTKTAKVLYLIWGHDGRGGVRPRKFVFTDEIKEPAKVVGELKRIWMVKDAYWRSISGHTSIVVRVRFGAYNLLMPAMAKAIARALELDHLQVESVEYSPWSRRDVAFEKNRWGIYRQAV